MSLFKPKALPTKSQIFNSTPSTVVLSPTQKAVINKQTSSFIENQNKSIQSIQSTISNNNINPNVPSLATVNTGGGGSPSRSSSSNPKPKPPTPVVTETTVGNITTISVNPDANLKDIINNKSFQKIDNAQGLNILKQIDTYQTQKNTNRANFVGSVVMNIDNNKPSPIVVNRDMSSVKDSKSMVKYNVSFKEPVPIPTIQATPDVSFKDELINISADYYRNIGTNVKTKGLMGGYLATGLKANAQLTNYGFGKAENYYVGFNSKNGKYPNLKKIEEVGLGFGYATAGGIVLASTVASNPLEIKNVPKGLIGYSKGLIYRVKNKPFGAIGEITAIVGVKGIKSEVRGLNYDLFGKEVDATKIYSKDAMNSPQGLDQSFNPEKTIRMNKKSIYQDTFKYPELTGKQLVVSGTNEAKTIKYVKTKSELNQPYNESGGQFVSSLGYGQPRFNRIEPTSKGYTTEDLTLSQKLEKKINSVKNSKVEYNPLSNIKGLFNNAKPTEYIIGVERTARYPKELLKMPKEKSIRAIEEFQKKQAGKGTIYVSRESELGIKPEPESQVPVTTRYKYIGKSDKLYTKLNDEYIKINLGITEINKGFKLEDMFKNEKYKTFTEKDRLKVLESSSKNIYSKINISDFMKPSYNKSGSYSKSSSSNLFYKSSSPYLSKSSSPYLSSSISSKSRGSSPIYSKSSSSNLFYKSSSPYLSKSSSPYLSSSISSKSRGSSPIYSNSSSSNLFYKSSSPYLSKSSSNSSSYSRSKSFLSSSYNLPSISYNPYYNRINTQITQTRPTIRLNKSKFKSERKNQNGFSYAVQIKEGKNWVNVKDKMKRNLGSALNFGSNIVDNYKERSFRLRRTGGRPTDIQPNPPLFKFYQPSKTRNPKLTGAWIEKTPYLIDTMGEVRGISYKGIQARKN